MGLKKTNKGYFSITTLAEAFDIDERLIRHFESKSLVSPLNSRQDGHVFSLCDKTRLKLITRAMQVDYSLGDIEALIGKNSPHLSETDLVNESLIFAGKKFELLRKSLADSDVLEQINITCDLELLGDYLKELNAIKSQGYRSKLDHQRHAGNHQPDHEKTITWVKSPVKRKPVVINAAVNMRAIPLKKPILAAILIVLLTLTGYSLLFNKPQPMDLVASSTENGAGDLDRNPAGSPEEAEPEEAERDKTEIETSHQTDTTPLSDELPADESLTLTLLAGLVAEKADAPAQPSENILVNKSLMRDAATQPEETQSGSAQQKTVQQELINKLVSDLQTKYNVQSTDATMTEDTPSQDASVLNRADTEKGDLNTVAGLTASLALMQKADKGSLKNVDATQKPEKIAAQEMQADPPVKQPETKVTQKIEAEKTPKKLPAKEPSVQKAKTDKTAQVELKTATASIAPVAKASNPPKQTVAKKSKASVPSKSEGVASSKKVSKTKPPLKKSTARKAIDPAALDWAKKSRENYQKGDMGETIVSATVSLSIEPGQVHPYIDRALAYKQKGLFDKALTDCNKAILNDPDSSISVYTRGVVYQAMGQAQKARTDYEKACAMGFAEACGNQTASLQKETVNSLMKQSRQSFRQGNWDAVISTTTDVLKQDPINVTAYVTRSAAYSQKKLFSKTISDCDAALKIDPGYALAFNNRGYAFERLGKRDDAVRDYKKACGLGLTLGCKNYEKF